MVSPFSGLLFQLIELLPVQQQLAVSIRFMIVVTSLVIG